MRRSMVPLLAAGLALSACMTPPQPVEDPIPYIEQNQPARVWLATSEDTVPIVVLRPRIFGDTLLARRETGEVVWIGTREVRRLEVQRPDVLRTTLLAAGIGVAAISILALLSGEGDSDPRVGIDVPEGWIGQILPALRIGR
jgi:hypothetical protein